MIYPAKLETGSKIGVTAPSDGYNSEVDIVRLESAICHFASLGYPVIETEHVRSSHKGRSSDGRTRAKELMELFLNPEVKAIISASGGDYLVEMLSYLDFDVLSSNPTWFQGYSDNTGITFTITTNLDMPSIYATNFGSFGMKHWHSSLMDNLKIIEGQDIIQNSFDKFQDGFKERITGLEEYVLEAEVEWKTIPATKDITEEEYRIRGRALGGCLDVLLHLVGTRFDKTKEFIQKYKNDGILWYLESFDLNSEALTRGLWQLKEAGWFEYAVGFLFGRPAMFTSYSDTTYEEAVLSVLGDLGVPIILDADIGHKPPQLTMINGAIANLHITGPKGSISFERR